MNEFEPRKWSPEQLDMVINRRLRPFEKEIERQADLEVGFVEAIRALQKEVEDLRKENKHLQYQIDSLAEKRVRDWNELSERIQNLWRHTPC